VLQYDAACSTEYPVSHGVQVLAKVLQDMEMRRPLYYFTAPGMVRVGIGTFVGLSFLRTFYHGGSLMFGPTLLMIMLSAKKIHRKGREERKAKEQKSLHSSAVRYSLKDQK
jgi:hypothetical protein